MISHQNLVKLIMMVFYFCHLVFQPGDMVSEPKSCYNNCDTKHFPYITSIGIRDPAKYIGDTKLSLCSGTLIKYDWVLTLSKCVHKANPKLQYVGAAANFDLYNAKYVIQISQSVRTQVQITNVLAGYTYSDGVNYKTDPLTDLGLLRVEPLKHSYLIAPAKLPDKEVVTTQCINTGRKVVVVGFGDNYDYSNLNTRDESCRCLKCNDLTLDHLTARCATTWIGHPYASDGTVFCATKAEVPNAIFAGDDGGPVVCDNKVIGIVALHRPKDGSQEGAAAFTAISKYYTFISKRIGQNLGFESAPKPLTDYS